MITEENVYMINKENKYINDKYISVCFILSKRLFKSV